LKNWISKSHEQFFYIKGETMISEFLSRRALPLIGMFSSMLILLIEGANLARGDFIPPSDLSPGKPYQLIFVTAGTSNAANSDIAAYNAFVTLQADALSSYVPAGTTWYAVASTYDVASTLGTNAKDNAAAYKDIPIYNTQGQRVADGYADLWDASTLKPLQHPIKYDQFGAALPDDTIVWTGSKTDGTVKFLYGTKEGPLGSLDPDPDGDNYTVFGSSTSTIGKWINRGSLVDFYEEHCFYALSSQITVPEIPIPEPGTLTLLVLGGLTALAATWIRQKLS
jgi:hypothetical protein